MGKRQKYGPKKRDSLLIEKRIKRVSAKGIRIQDAIKVGGRDDGGYDEHSENQILEAINEAKQNDWNNYS